MKLFLMLFLISSNLSFGQSNLEKVTLTKRVRERLTQSSINPNAISKAFDFYEKNKVQYQLSDQYLAIADFSRKSNLKRLFVINLQSGSIDLYKVAHGKGSDKNHDLIFDDFSDRPQSYSTPEGFHKMTTIYHGKHGLSLRMQGLEGKNKTSLERAIVLHGADYVSWPHTGRSQGCPAVEKKYVKKIIEQLKDGALFYHYK